MHRRRARGPLYRHGSIAAAILVAALAASACGGGSQPARTPRSTPATVALPRSPTELPAFDAPRFELLLAKLRGTPVVVNVWASWCGPCIDEAPELARVATAFEGRVQFVGVDIQDQPAVARAFVRRFGWTYPSVADPTGAIRDSLGVLGQPVTIVYDANGKRAWVSPGPTTARDLTDVLTRVLSGRDAS